MKDRDLFGIFFWMGIGFYFCIGALTYRLFEENLPGSGLLPFFVGIVLISLGIILFISLIKEKKEKIPKERFFPEKSSLKKLFFAVLALSLYGLFLEYIGFLFITFLFMIFLLRFIEPQRWVVTLTISALITVCSYILFQILLKAQLPKGFLGM
jgi:putative tricarboxylic transport membrane protein